MLLRQPLNVQSPPPRSNRSEGFFLRRRRRGEDFRGLAHNSEREKKKFGEEDVCQMEELVVVGEFSSSAK